MSDLAKFMLKALARKGLTILGTFLITHGLLDKDSADDFASAWVEQVVGFLLVGAAAVWTFIYQKYVKDKVVAALSLPAGTSTEKLEAVVSGKP